MAFRIYAPTIQPWHTRTDVVMVEVRGIEPRSTPNSMRFIKCSSIYTLFELVCQATICRQLELTVSSSHVGNARAAITVTHTQPFKKLFLCVKILVAYVATVTNNHNVYYLLLYNKLSYVINRNNYHFSSQGQIISWW
jgi:hypothetical protein